MTEYRVTWHAKSRFAERGPAGGVLDVELANSVPVGAQRGDGFMRYMPCGLVAAGRIIEGEMIVTTVLTRDHAMANMQAQKLRVLAPTTKPPDSPTAATPKKLTKKQAIRAQRRDIPGNFTGGVVVPAPMKPIDEDTKDPLDRKNPTPAIRLMRRQSVCKGIDRLVIHLACVHAVQSVPKQARKTDLSVTGLSETTAMLGEYETAYKASMLTLGTVNGLFRDAAKASGDPGLLEWVYKIIDELNPIPREKRTKAAQHTETTND